MVGKQLARLLEASRQPFAVKIIEKNQKRCEELCKGLKDTLILQGDVTGYAMLKEEDPGITDAIIAVAGDDRNNIVRNEELLIPGGDTMLLPGGHLIIFSLPKAAHQLERCFAQLGNNKRQGFLCRRGKRAG